MADTVVYRASKIITMDPTRPEATHVAVRDGLIVAVGDADCATPWGDFRRDIAVVVDAHGRYRLPEGSTSPPPP